MRTFCAARIAESESLRRTPASVGLFSAAAILQAIHLELQTDLILIERLRLATPDQVQPLLDRASEVGRMLNGLIKSLERHQAAPKTTDDE